MSHFPGDPRFGVVVKPTASELACLKREAFLSTAVLDFVLQHTTFSPLLSNAAFLGSLGTEATIVSKNLTASLKRDQVKTSSDWKVYQDHIQKTRMKFKNVLKTNVEDGDAPQRLIVPIVRESHFFVVCFEFSLNAPDFFVNVWFYDSLERSQKRIHRSTNAADIVKKVNFFFKSYILHEPQYQHLHQSDNALLRRVQYRDCPWQENGYDCGIFAVAVVLHLLNQNLVVGETSFTQRNVTEGRKLLAKAFIRTKTISVDDIRNDFRNCFPLLRVSNNTPAPVCDPVSSVVRATQATEARTLRTPNANRATMVTVEAKIVKLAAKKQANMKSPTSKATSVKSATKKRTSVSRTTPTEKKPANMVTLKAAEIVKSAAKKPANMKSPSKTQIVKSAIKKQTSASRRMPTEKKPANVHSPSRMQTVKSATNKTQTLTLRARAFSSSDDDDSETIVVDDDTKIRDDDIVFFEDDEDDNGEESLLDTDEEEEILAAADARRSALAAAPQAEKMGSGSVSSLSGDTVIYDVMREANLTCFPSLEAVKPIVEAYEARSGNYLRIKRSITDKFRVYQCREHVQCPFEIRFSRRRSDGLFVISRMKTRSTAIYAAQQRLKMEGSGRSVAMQS